MVDTQLDPDCILLASCMVHNGAYTVDMYDWWHDLYDGVVNQIIYVQLHIYSHLVQIHR